MNKWDTWWDSLSPSTQEYLKSQAIWHDIDMFKAAAVGAFVGFLIGLLFYLETFLSKFSYLILLFFFYFNCIAIRIYSQNKKII